MSVIKNKLFVNKIFYFKALKKINYPEKETK